MLNLLDSVRGHCPEVPATLMDMHFRRLPPSYFERYAPAEIARHLRLLARVSDEQPVEVAIRPLAPQTFEVLVVGHDHSGTVACITAALAADGFDLQDLHVATYLDCEMALCQSEEPEYFVLLLLVSGTLRGQALPDLTAQWRSRLGVAFAHLAAGKFHEAQAAAARTRASCDPAHPTPHPGRGPKGRTEREGLMLGGDFRLEHRLATGGMSEVHLATQVSLNRVVAIKLFRREGTADEDLLARFSQEGLVLGQMNCPFIVQVLAAGNATNSAGETLNWMAMEYVAGGDLATWLQQHGSTPTELGCRWFRQALEGLAYAHRKGILHRDLKPHNLLLTAEGDLKISDFGLLKQVQQPVFGLTPRSAVLGTPHYMAPEQALGEPIDERADIFSLGTTFFHLFSGRLPFDKSNAPAVLMQILHEDAPSLAAVAPQTPRPLAVIIGRMMARRREDRYQDIGVILEDLVSYERRGLLQCQEGTSFPPPTGPAPPGDPMGITLLYEPPPGGDEVVI